MKTKLLVQNTLFSMFFLMMVSPIFSQTATFEALGFIDEHPIHPEFAASYGYKMSQDGLVVVGLSSNDQISDYEAFIWENGTMTGLGILDGNLSSANGISADGTVLSGFSTLQGEYRAVRWDNGNITNLGILPDHAGSMAESVSQDGSKIVGQSWDTNYNTDAVFWENGNVISLGHLNGGTSSFAYGISVDGTVIVGSSNSLSDEIQQAVKWENGTITALGSLPGNGIGSQANGISLDGTTIYGISSSQNSDFPLEGEAFRLKNGVMEGLGFFPGGNHSVALATSHDGEIIVGFSNNNSDYRGFIWTAATGMQSLTDILENEFNLDLGNILYIDRVCDIKVVGDLIYLTGSGVNLDMTFEAWHATIPLSYLLNTTDFSKTALSIYPNPTTGIINLQAKEKINSVSVYNSVGQKVSFNSLNQENNSIDISNLSNGIYFVEVILNDKTIKRHKVIKK